MEIYGPHWLHNAKCLFDAKYKPSLIYEMLKAKYQSLLPFDSISSENQSHQAMAAGLTHRDICMTMRQAKRWIWRIISRSASPKRAFCVYYIWWQLELLLRCGVFLVLPVGAVAANDQRDDIAGSGKKETHHLQGQCARGTMQFYHHWEVHFRGQALASLLHSRAAASGQLNSIPFWCWTIYTNMRQIVCSRNAVLVNWNLMRANEWNCFAAFLIFVSL